MAFLDEAVDEIAQTLRDIEACNLSGLHSATWKCTHDTFSSLARKRMQLGLSPTHPRGCKFAPMLRLLF